jgi:HPt (histidine-containing phosphotransfer) domain-containing protein
MTNDTEKMVDTEQFDSLKELFSDGFGDFIKTYFEDYESKEKELRTAIDNKDLKKVASIAHALKGTSANIGANALAKACHQLESASKNDNFEESKHEFAGMVGIYPKVKVEFQRLTGC